MNFNEFLKECYDKEIVKSLTIFIISFWTIIQVSHVTHEAVGLPEEFVSFLIILFFITLPVYVFYTWNKKGKEQDFESLDETGQAKRKSFRLWFLKSFTATSVVCFLMALFIFSNKFSSKSKQNFSLTKQNNDDKIAVIEFRNNTGKPANDIVGQMSSDWISHGITSEGIAQVISSEVVNGYNEVIELNQIKVPKLEFIQKYLRPGQVIMGSFFEDGNELVFNSSITNGNTNEVIFSFEPERCARDSPLECIDNLKESILSFLVDEDHSDNLLEQKPPKFQAYQLLLQAKNLQNSSSQEYLRLLDKAIEIDSDYFEAKVSRIAYYYNIGEYAIARSFIHSLKEEEKDEDVNYRQANILNLYEALLDGKNDVVYETMKNEYELTPFELDNNNSMMIIALQYVNLPEEVVQIKDEINNGLMDQKNCRACSNRMKVIMDAHLSLQEYDSVKTLYQRSKNLQKSLPIITANLTAEIRSDNHEAVKQIIEDAEQDLNSSEFDELLMTVDNEGRLVGLSVALLASPYFEKLSNQSKSFIQFHKGDYHNAIEQLSKKSPLNHKEKSYLAAALFRSDKQQKANEIIDEMKTYSNQYDYGHNEYEIARFYALTGQNESSLAYLTKAIKEGYFFTSNTFQNDADFKELQQNSEFQKLLDYWKNKL